MQQGKPQRDLQTWLNNRLIPRFGIRVLPLTSSDFQRWGELMGEAEKSGEPLRPVDTLLAAVALNHNLILVTRNTRNFAHTGVRIINPRG